MADTRTSNSIKNSGATIFGRMATMLMDFVLRTVLIRYLGIEYGGVSSLFTDILQVLSLVELGLGGAIIYALYKPLALKDYSKINALMHFYRNAYNAIAVVVLLLGLGCIPFLDGIVRDVPNIKEDVRLIFMMYVAASSCSYLVIYKETLIGASQQSRITVRIEMAVHLFFMAVECVCLLVFRKYMIYLVLRIVTYLVRNLLISREVKKRFPEVNFKSKERLRQDERRQLMKDIGAMALYKVSGVVLNGTDSIIISAALGTGVVGIMGQFRMISNFISNMSNKVWVAVLPSVGNMAALDGAQKQFSVYKRVSLASFLFATFCSVGMFILMNPLVALWVGVEYTLPTQTVFAIAFNMYLFLTILPFQTFRDANGLFVQGKYRPLIMSAINVVLSLILVKPWGLFGVLIATPISRLLTQTWFDPYVVYKYVFECSPLPYYLEFLLHFVVTCICGLLTWYLYGECNIKNGVLQIVVGVLLCAAVPILVYALLFGRNAQFRQLIEMVRGVCKRVLRK